MAAGKWHLPCIRLVFLTFGLRPGRIFPERQTEEQRNHGCHCTTKTISFIVFPGHYPQVTAEQLEWLLKLCAAKGGGKEGEDVPNTRFLLPPRRETSIHSTSSVCNRTCPLINKTRCLTLFDSTERRLSGFLVVFFLSLDSSHVAIVVSAIL